MSKVEDVAADGAPVWSHHVAVQAYAVPGRSAAPQGMATADVAATLPESHAAVAVVELPTAAELPTAVVELPATRTTMRYALIALPRGGAVAGSSGTNEKCGRRVDTTDTREASPHESEPGR